MNDFNKQLNQFLIDGQFTNNIDDVGNINLSTDPTVINERYIATTLVNVIYNAPQIETLYDVNILEFTIPAEPTQQISVNTNVEQLVQENESLKNQLTAVIAASNINSNNSDALAAKNTIINLRIQLGQGKTPEDFSDVYPYLKK